MPIARFAALPGRRSVDPGSKEPFNPWVRSYPAEILEVLAATYDIVRNGGDERDLVTRLVEGHGETETLQMLALIQVTSTRVTIARTETMQAVTNLPGWEDRRCPTCGAVCDECIADAEDDVRNALGDPS